MYVCVYIRVCMLWCQEDLFRDMVFKSRFEVYGELSQLGKSVDKNVLGREGSVREGLEMDVIVVSLRIERRQEGMRIVSKGSKI